MWPSEITPSGVPADSGGRDDPAAARMDVRITAGRQAPAIARTTVERWLFGRVPRRTFDDMRLLVSELVTNSVRHAGRGGDANIRVRVAIADGVVRLEVEDAGNAAIAAVAPDREHGGGFGLFLVDTLAQQWGSSNDGHTRVWAELAV